MRVSVNRYNRQYDIQWGFEVSHILLTNFVMLGVKPRASYMPDKQVPLSQMSSSSYAEHFQRALTDSECLLMLWVAPPRALGPRNKRGTKEKVPLALALTYCEWTYLPCLPSWEGLDLRKLGTKANSSSLKMFAQGNFGLSDRGGEKILTD